MKNIKNSINAIFFQFELKIDKALKSNNINQINPSKVLLRPLGLPQIKSKITLYEKY